MNDFLRVRLACVVMLVIALTGAVLGPAVAEPPPAQYLPGFDPTAPLPPGLTVPTFQFPSAQDIFDLPAPPDPTTSPDEYEIYEEYVTKLSNRKNLTPGSPAHFYARWEDYKARGGDSSFEEYRQAYARMRDNAKRGKAFEPFIRNNSKNLFSGKGWQFDKPVAGTGVGEKPDAYSDSEPYAYEFKASAELRAKQLDGFVKLAQLKNKTFVYLFQQRPSKAALDAIEKANLAMPENQGLTSGQTLNRVAFIARYYPATAVGVSIPDSKKAPPRPTWTSATSAGNGGVLAAPGQHTQDGALNTALVNSPDSPEAAARAAALAEDIAKQDAAELGAEYNEDESVTESLGGVDFSTLQLRYVTDSYQGQAAQFAFQADAAPNEQVSYGGRTAAKLASDAFFVWLELPTDVFTVNLSPDEPDRIINDQFGRTDAGRVLLQADLLMKKTTAKLIDPDTPLGRQFWDGLHGAAESKCMSERSWIVPGTATVRDTGNELYILDAPLTVKTESDYLASAGAGSASACTKDADAEYNAQLFRTMIVPLVQKQVNEAPEYADLRRVYFSRVAAQWYRDRSRTKHTTYSDLIDKGDISRWVTKENWTPKVTYDQYVTSYRDGEFHRSYTTTKGDMIETWTYVFGGVDFSAITDNSLTGPAFTNQHPKLPQTVGNSLYGPVSDNDAKNVWLGGLTASRPIDQLPIAPPSPATSRPLFYVLTILPILAWLIAGGWLLIRRRRPVPTFGRTS